ncbi:RcnB family protein [Cupriavidus sp. USMAHM13]|uniref:RcnB family protein n=1 Tax=Cupriavidus sp. USMAHM13 TaxID=1389192 RepID=UPI0009F65AFC|nr:RcnB family protein [Cupriavidus sp. USMAHM13]
MTKSKLLSSLLLAAIAMSSATGFAQDRDDRDHRGGPPPGQENRGRGPERDRGPDRDRGPEGRMPPRGGWHKGDRLPPEYRDRQYVIDNWREHRLTPPPRGYQWVGVGGDYFLVAIPTGLVFQVVIGH